MLESPGYDTAIASWLLAAFGAAALGSFFAAADRALVLLPEARLTVLVDGDAPTPFRRYAHSPQRILARWLVCRTVAIAIAAAFVVRACDRLGTSHTISIVVAVLTATAAYGSFAEFFLSYARRRPESFGAFALRIARPVEWLVMPIAEPLYWLGQLVARQVPEQKAVDVRTTMTEVELVVAEGERTGTLGNEPAEMIRNVLEFKDLTAREVMVPRPRITALEISTPLKEVLHLVSNDGHSRCPVYRETLDNVVGILYAKDLFAVLRDGKETTTKLEQLVRSPVLFVIETQPIVNILREMRAKRVHLAVVSDEFGGTSGIVTLEDLLEEIVGDIRDEYDTDADTPIQDLGEGRLLADAAVPISDVEHKLGREITTDGDVDSIGGLIVQHSGRVPEVGATMTIDGLELIVRDADERRVVKVEIVPKQSEDAAEPAHDASAP